MRRSVPAMPSSSSVAHETYPGHRTERAWKEQLLTPGTGGSRKSVRADPDAAVGHCPQGIATLAADIALGAERHDVHGLRGRRGSGVRCDPELSRGR